MCEFKKSIPFVLEKSASEVRRPNFEFFCENFKKNHNSKPEVDFVAVPTAFSNVWSALKKPLKIFGQGSQEGVEIKKVQNNRKF